MGFVKNIQTTKADIGRVEDILRYPEDEKFRTDLEKRPLRTKLDLSLIHICHIIPTLSLFPESSSAASPSRG